MELKRSVLIDALAASLLDAASVFGDPDTADGQASRAAAFDRHLSLALTDQGRVLPCEMADTLTISAGLADYAAPVGALGFIRSSWVERNSCRQPWDADYVAVVPSPMLVRTATGWFWRFSPLPDFATVQRLGSAFQYTYRAAHRLTENEADATFPAEQAPLLILRAQSAAMSDLAIRNAHKPVQMRDGLFSQTRNGTPAAIADQLLKMWEQQTRQNSQLYGIFQ